MAENLYTDPGGGSFGLFTNLIMPIGMWEANKRMGRWMLPHGGTGNLSSAERYNNIYGKKFGGGAASRRMSQMSSNAWKSFFQPGMGWDLGARFDASRATVGTNARTFGAGKTVGARTRIKMGFARDWTPTGQSLDDILDMPMGQATQQLRLNAAGDVFEKGIKRTAARASIGRTAAALARPVVGVGAAYFAWGWLLPLAAEGLVGGFNELARQGERFRRGTPETSVGFREMGMRDTAKTMRQASQMAIHTSQMGIRAALGSEASFMHS